MQLARVVEDDIVDMHIMFLFSGRSFPHIMDAPCYEFGPLALGHGRERSVSRN
jgi:hypothetical protein